MNKIESVHRACTAPLDKEKTVGIPTVFLIVVEMAGIEPASESASTGIFSERSLWFFRPNGGTFALSARHRHSVDLAIP